MGKRRTNITAQKCVHFRALEDPKKHCAHIFWRPLWVTKKTGVAKLRPSLLCGLPCLIDPDFWIETSVYTMPSSFERLCGRSMHTGSPYLFPSFWADLTAIYQDQRRFSLNDLSPTYRREKCWRKHSPCQDVAYASYLLVHQTQTNFDEKGTWKVQYRHITLKAKSGFLRTYVQSGLANGRQYAGGGGAATQLLLCITDVWTYRLIADDMYVHKRTADKPHAEGKTPVSSILCTRQATNTCGGERNNTKGWVVGYVLQLLWAENKRTAARSATGQLISDTSYCSCTEHQTYILQATAVHWSKTTPPPKRDSIFKQLLLLLVHTFSVLSLQNYGDTTSHPLSRNRDQLFEDLVRDTAAFLKQRGLSRARIQQLCFVLKHFAEGTHLAACSVQDFTALLRLW